MNGHRFPQLIDIPTLLDRELDYSRSLELMIRHLKRNVPPFNYLEVVGATSSIITKARSRQEAIATCGRMGSKKGYVYNQHVAGLTYDRYGGRGLRASRVKAWNLPVDPDAKRWITVRPSAKLTEGGQARLLLTQTRKNCQREPWQWGLIGFAYSQALAISDHAGLDLEIFDTSAPDKKSQRQPHSFLLSNLRLADAQFAMEAFALVTRTFEAAAPLVPQKKDRRPGRPTGMDDLFAHLGDE